MPADNTPQIRGALLEELLLHFLRKTGYKIISEVGTDITLQNGPAGIQIKGRGGNHQIDAIADSVISHPFSHPQRLLVEAKCYEGTYKVGIDIVRNAVGVLKDVCEYWTSESSVAKCRYHYQYALFSASPYTAPTERYAFAHDIYLIPLENSKFLGDAIERIRNVRGRDFPRDFQIGDLRKLIREWWKTNQPPDFLYDYYPVTIDKLTSIYEEGRRIGFALLAVLGRSFPVFLIPNPELNLDNLRSNYRVRIFWDSDGWYLRDLDDRNLFSFDLPTKLFELYSEEGILTQNNALDLKETMMSDFMAYYTNGNEIRLIRFQLDNDWLIRIKDDLATRDVENNR